MNSLSSLTLSCYPQVHHFNIPRILDSVSSLRVLRLKAHEVHHHIHSSPGSSTGGTSAAASMENVHVPQSMIPPISHDCDFRREMEGELPSKLSQIEFIGTGIKSLGDNLFAGVRSPYLQVVLKNTSVSQLPSSFFSNLGAVKNISLDLSGHNDHLKTVPNPNTASSPHLPDKVFLTSLRMGSNSLDCDCSVGWIEFWHRKKRQFLCSAQMWSEDLFGTKFYDSQWDETQQEICQDTEHGLREATCSNKKNENLVEVLKSELECGWGSGAANLQRAAVVVVLSLIFLVWM